MKNVRLAVNVFVLIICNCYILYKETDTKELGLELEIDKLPDSLTLFR